MEQNIAMVLGAILPFIISLVKRFVPMNEMSSYSFVFICCLAVSVGLRMNANGWNWYSLLSDFTTILATSQVVFAYVLKNLGIDQKIEQ